MTALMVSNIVDKVINIDQSPIGRTPRSNPGTYTGLFDQIRTLFAELPESKMRGYKPGAFHSTCTVAAVKPARGRDNCGSRCSSCPMYTCPATCAMGQRFNRETLQVKFKNLNIADVLDLTVDRALEVFEAFPNMLSTPADPCRTLVWDTSASVSPPPHLSGGEAQRVKLAQELSTRATGRTLYVLDEPSVGLHAADVHKLIEVLQRLVDAGNTVLIIEHNLDIIKVADHIIDLGPEGGDGGGELIAEGSPEEICEVEASYTAKFLRPYVCKGENMEPIRV